MFCKPLCGDTWAAVISRSEGCCRCPTITHLYPSCGARSRLSRDRTAPDASTSGRFAPLFAPHVTRPAYFNQGKFLLRPSACSDWSRVPNRPVQMCHRPNNLTPHQFFLRVMISALFAPSSATVPRCVKRCNIGNPIARSMVFQS